MVQRLKDYRDGSKRWKDYKKVIFNVIIIKVKAISTSIKTQYEKQYIYFKI